MGVESHLSVREGTEGSRVSRQGNGHQFLGCGQSQLSLADVTHQ